MSDQPPQGDNDANDAVTDIEDDDDLIADLAAELDEELADAAAGLGDEEPFVDGTIGRSDLAAERDEYLDALRRVKAEFDNFRKRTDKEREAAVDKRVGSVVTEILPVLDACDAAIAHGDEGVAQIRNLLFDVLAKSGLELDEPEGKPFDPNRHDAVLQEPGDGESETVVEVLRSGYSWRGRVIRPAMVKVRT